MVVGNLDDDAADRVFQALADTTRRDIVRRVTAREQSVSELAGAYSMSFAAVQKHVAVLERARLITKERRGREQIVHGNPETVRAAALLLDDLELIWRTRIRAMDELLAGDHPITDY